jgi:acetoacetate decarboxylase
MGSAKPVRSGAPEELSIGLPPMPWTLQAAGPVLASLHPVRMEAARGLVPSAFRILPIFPGFTLGGLFLAHYGPGSDLRYRELIVAGATILHASRPVPWITHIFVDSEDSVLGGRALLGAPKFLAEFEEHRRGSVVRVEVGGPDGPICSIRYRQRLTLWPQRIPLDAAHLDSSIDRSPGVRIHRNQLRGRLGLAGASVRFPAGGAIERTGMVQRCVATTLAGALLVLGGARDSDVGHRI